MVFITRRKYERYFWNYIFKTCFAVDSRNLVTYPTMNLRFCKKANEQTGLVHEAAKAKANSNTHSIHVLHLEMFDMHASKEVEVSIMHYVINESQALANIVHCKFYLCVAQNPFSHNRWI